jgi:hypothetical protein
MTDAIKSQANGPTSLLTLSQETRQQIYYDSFATAYEDDLMHNKKQFCFAKNCGYEPSATDIPAMKKWARELNNVHLIISAELPFVLNKIKRELDEDFARIKPAGRLHLGFRCDTGGERW